MAEQFRTAKDALALEVAKTNAAETALRQARYDPPHLPGAGISLGKVRERDQSRSGSKSQKRRTPERANELELAAPEN